MTDEPDLEEDDAPGERLSWDGSEKRTGPRDGVDRDAVLEQRHQDERETFVRHIAGLRARLRKYEPDGRRDPRTGTIIPDANDGDETTGEGGDGALGTVVLGGTEDPALRAQVVKLQAQLDRARAEQRVSDDAIREHIRQKMALRKQLEEAHAGRGGRADGVPPAAVAVGDPAPEQPPAAADHRPAPAAPALGAVLEPGVVPRGKAAGAVVTWGPRGEPKIVRALRELGECTVEQLVRHLKSTRQAVGMGLSNHAAHIDSRLVGDGVRKAYRLKA